MTRVTRLLFALACLPATAFCATASASEPALSASRTVTAEELELPRAASTVAAESLPASSPSSTISSSRVPAAPAPAIPRPVARLDEVVVTASRYPTRRRETPDTVTVVTRSSLEEERTLDLGDAVERTAGVEVVRRGGPGAISDISIRGSRASQVLVLEDGRPLNSSSLGLANASLVPVGSIDRVEVLRGPSGLLYGSSPLGGVVNVITPPPPPVFSGDLAAEDGTFGTRLTRVSAGGPLGPVRFLIRDERTRSDGARLNSDVRSEETLLKVEALDNPRIEAQAGAMNDDLGTPGVEPAADPALRTGTQAIFGNGEVSSLIDRQRDSRRWVMEGVSWSIAEAHVFSVKHYAEENRIDADFGGFPFPWPGPFANDPGVTFSRMTSYVMGLEGQYTTGPWEAERARLTAGGSWRRERMSQSQDDFDTVTLDTTPGPAFRSAAETGAAYADLSVRPLARIAGLPGIATPVLGNLCVVGGGRYDHHSLFGGVTNGHAGMAWDIDGTTARASAGNTFRAPTLSDLLQPLVSGTAGNPNLRPERGRTVEWSVERTEGPCTVRVGGYARKVHDQIDWAPDADAIWRPSNVGVVVTRGEEAEVSARAGRFRFDGNLTSIRSTQRREEATMIDLGTYVPTATVTRVRRTAHVPAYTAAGALTVKLPWNSELTGTLRNVGARVAYYSKTDYATGAVAWNTKRLAPFTTAGVRASKRLGRRAEVYFGVSNLADARFSEAFGNDINDRDFPMPPRTYYAGASVKW